jgi:methyl-accepting chemotaxis protein
MPGSRFSPLSPAVRLMRTCAWSTKLAWVGLPLVASQSLCAAAALGAVPSAALMPVLGSSLALFSVAAYLGLAFHASVRGSLRLLQDGVKAVSGGDLSHKIELPGRDELATIGTAVEGMNMRLSSLVAEIRTSAVRVGMSGQQVASSSESLAQRTEQQAASLRQTVETVQQLTDAVTANAAAASQLDQLTERLKSEAEQGGAAMRGSVEAMAGLEDSSRRVGEIIGVIDGIAFQTNILALNAAVEAARAGEAGRGFAVVAAEVRQLAQRSSSAASEIRQLIARSGEQVESSVKQTRAVGQVLDSLVGGVRNVSQSLRQIAEASARQSGELTQVSQSVGQLDEITRQNAAMVEQSAEASHDLVGRAKTLSSAVASIRLRQGSADEARALVERAVALIKSRGQATAAQSFHAKDAGFLDRDMYIFVIDRSGTYKVHGAKPAMEGKRVHEVPGIDGNRFLQDAWAAAPGAGGWIEYDIVNPESGAVQPKASFVVQIDAQHFVGCGVYRQTGAVAFAKAAA